MPHSGPGPAERGLSRARDEAIPRTYWCYGGPARKSDPVSLQQSLLDLAIVSLLAALTPVVAGLLASLRVPQVVILIVGGILIGPQVSRLANPDSLGLIANVGLGFLFLLAGYELDLGLFR